MARVEDVAKYILQKAGEMTSMKLQKLVYYCQAWSLVWDEAPMFSEKIEAWANGPVVPSLYNLHRGMFKVNEDFPHGDAKALDENQIDTINMVLKVIGDKTGQWLSELTHNESPWKDAREGLAPTERSNREIPLSVIHEYYSSL